MGVHSGPDAVNDGLILYLDASNKDCYNGIGVERIGTILPAFGNWGGLTGTSVTYNSSYGTGVNLTTLTGGGVNWWYGAKGSQPCSPSTQYIITARVKYAGSATTPHPNLFYVRQYNSSGAQTSESGKFNTVNTKSIGDGWYIAWAYFTTDSTATSFLVHGYEYSANMIIWLEDLQCKLAGLADLSGNGNDHTITGTPGFYFGKWFSLNGSDQGFTRNAALNGATSTCTVVLHYSTLDGQELWAMGNNSTSYYLSASSGNNYYHAQVGSPTNWVNLNRVYNPSTEGYRNGVTNMWEAKGVDFTGWTRFDWFLYPGGWQMSGSVNTIMVYNRVLTAAESAQNYIAFRPRFAF